MNPTFKASVTPLFQSIKRRHRVRASTAEQRKLIKAGVLKLKDVPLKYGKCPITLDEFAEWMWEKSQNGLTWKCELSGNIVQLKAKSAAGRLTIDHRVPLAHGGTSDLNNLAVCSEEANRIKGDMSIGCYSRLMTALYPEHPSDRESVLKRLKGYNPSWRKRA